MQTGNLGVCSRDFSRAPEEVSINTGLLWFVTTPVLHFRPDLSAHPHPCHVYSIHYFTLVLYVAFEVCRILIYLGEVESGPLQRGISTQA